MQYSIKTCYTLSKYCNDPNVVNCPSQHLDHLQQLDNLEHSAHLYGQLTAVGLFTTIWSCTNIVNSPKGCEWSKYC
jgi:hypothetical protein